MLNDGRHSLLLLSSLVLPFSSFCLIDHSLPLAILLVTFGLIFTQAVMKICAGDFERRSPLPSPRGASLSTTVAGFRCWKKFRHMFGGSGGGGGLSSLTIPIYYCLAIQLFSRIGYFSLSQKIDLMVLNRPLTAIGAGSNAIIFQREMQNLLITWRLENTVENDPLTKALFKSYKLGHINIPYLTQIIQKASGPEEVVSTSGGGQEVVVSTGAGGGGGGIGAGEVVESVSVSPRGSTGLSVILPCHNEHPYIERTVISILNETSPLVLNEIIVIDDFNDPPISTALNEELLRHPKIKIVRNNIRQGLIRAKQMGGDMAKGSQLLFLDAHVKPFPRYLPWLLKDLNTRHSRIVVPSIPILNGDTWEQDGTAVGYKMMFDWQLRFNWFEDDDDEVPIMSGGLLALNKSWWNYTKGFDPDMDVWGGENIEQSVKTWMAGGEIVVNRNSLIAHYFRSKFPYSVDQQAVTRNKIRVATTWFDRWQEVIKVHIRSLNSPILDIGKAKIVRKSIAPNRNFDWYIDRFRKSLSRASLIHLPQFVISQGNDDCLSVINNSSLALQKCDTMRDYWILEGSPPDDVYPAMRENKLSAVEGEMSQASDCQENPVCRKNGAILRNPVSDVCIGAIHSFDAKFTESGFYLGVGKNCLRDGTFRDFAKTVGFVPIDIKRIDQGSSDQSLQWDNIIWNRVLPRPTRDFMYMGQNIKQNITNVSADQIFKSDQPYYTGLINWGSFCLDVGEDRRPLAKLCSPETPTQRWQFRFVNRPEDFWLLNK